MENEDLKKLKLHYGSLNKSSTMTIPDTCQHNKGNLHSPTPDEEWWVTQWLLRKGELIASRGKVVQAQLANPGHMYIWHATLNRFWGSLYMCTYTHMHRYYYMHTHVIIIKEELMNLGGGNTGGIGEGRTSSFMFNKTLLVIMFRCWFSKNLRNFKYFRKQTCFKAV